MSIYVYISRCGLWKYEGCLLLEEWPLGFMGAYVRCVWIFKKVVSAVAHAFAEPTHARQCIATRRYTNNKDYRTMFQ